MVQHSPYRAPRRNGVSPTASLSRFLAAAVFILGFVLPSLAGAGIYELESNPPTPIFVSESDANPSIDIEITGVTCMNTWGPSDWTVNLDHDDTTSADVVLLGPSLISFNDSTTSSNISVMITNDSDIEADESFDLVLTAMGTQFTCDTGTWDPGQTQYIFKVVIVDDDSSPDPKYNINDTQVVEGNEGTRSAVFSVTLDFQAVPRSPTEARGIFSVQWRTQPGSALPGSDFIATQGNLIFDNVQEPQEVRIPVLGDFEPEPDEQFTVELFNPIGGDIGRGIGQGTILNDDGLEPEISIQDNAIAEGDSGFSDLALTVSLSEASEQEVKVRYTTGDGTAEASDQDYRASQGSIVFAPGETQQTVTVQVRGDTRPEQDESFFVNLFDPDGAVIRDGEGRAGILDDDDGSEGPTLMVENLSVTEGDQGLTQAQVAVKLSQAADQDVTVDVATANGTAMANLDYQARQETLTFEPGETEKSFNVRIRGDTLVEGNETLFVRLSNADGAEIGQSEAVITILDDDEQGATPSLSINDVGVVEGNSGVSPAVFLVQLDQASDQTVEVDYSSSDGTAMTSDNDYRPVAGRLVFAPGQTSANVTVEVVGDTRAEDNEFFSVTLENPQGAVIARPVGRGGIADDDSEGGGNPSIIRLVSANGTTEGAGPAVVIVERQGSTNVPARVSLGTVAGTAQPGSDFQEVRTTLDWATGESGPKRVQIPVIDDNREEGREAFGVVLAQPVNARIVGRRQAAISIVDNDSPMEIQAVGDTELTATTGQELELQVRVEGDQNRPIAGAAVLWEAEGRARIVGEPRAFSDEQGLSGRTIALANNPGPAVVRIRLLGTNRQVVFQIRVEGNLTGPGPSGGPSQGSGIAQTLNESCADADDSSDYAQLCGFLFGLAGSDDQQQALDRLTPRSALAQARAALRGPGHQLRNVGSRLSALRGGMARQSLGQLAFNIQGKSLSLGPLQQAIAGYRHENDWASERVDGAIQLASGEVSQRRGGAASGDQDPLVDDGESPWGFFMNGRLSFGDAPRLGQTAGYEISTEGLSAGIDYRMDDRWVVGAALGYLRSDSDVEQDQGSFDLEGTSLTLYTTYYRESFYVDGVLSFGQNSYDIERVVELPRNLNGVTRFVAAGEPDSDQVAAHLGVGYDFLIGNALTLGGFVRGSWVQSTIEAYQERGALFFDLAFEEQETESLLGELGLEISRPFSLSWGVVQPQLRVTYLHEFEDGVQLLRARFAIDPSRRTFVIESDAQDQDFFNLALGVTLTLPRSWASYFQYDTDLERDDLDVYTLSGGFRFQF